MYSIDTPQLHCGVRSSRRDTVDIPTASGHAIRADRPCDHMDRDQHDPDQEQNPKNPDCTRRHPDKIQSTGNHTDHQAHQCLVARGPLLSMECERESNSPLEDDWCPGRLHEQTMTQGIQPFRETLTSKRRRLENRSRPEGSGSARDGTVSELHTSHHHPKRIGTVRQAI